MTSSIAKRTSVCCGGGGSNQSRSLKKLLTGNHRLFFLHQPFLKQKKRELSAMSDVSLMTPLLSGTKSPQDETQLIDSAVVPLLHLYFHALSFKDTAGCVGHWNNFLITEDPGEEPKS